MIALLGSGCTASWSSTDAPELVWGRRGLAPGRFDRPRAAAIDSQDRIYVVDKTGRIQVFNTDGQVLRSWRTPETERGQPCGLAIDRDGNLLVADTHYYRMLVYTPNGELLSSRTIGGENGNGPGQFNFVTDAAQDSRGNYYIAEYGLFDRVQKFDREGDFVLQWGGHGDRPGQFVQPRCLVMDERDRLWIADACNHRVQVFDVTGDEVRLERAWGTQGTQPGQLRYPYSLALDGKGHVYVAEFGNSRVQKFTLDGRFIASWGAAGRQPGELNQPWGIVRDSQGRLHVLDTYNHRVQRFRL